MEIVNKLYLGFLNKLLINVMIFCDKYIFMVEVL